VASKILPQAHRARVVCRGCPALLSPDVFPDLKPFHLFRVIRRPLIGELAAPFVSAIFWKIVMRYALEEKRHERNSVMEDFHAPFSGPLGAWRLMQVLRWGESRGSSWPPAGDVAATSSSNSYFSRLARSGCARRVRTASLRPNSPIQSRRSRLRSLHSSQQTRCGCLRIPPFFREPVSHANANGSQLRYCWSVGVSTTKRKTLLHSSLRLPVLYWFGIRRPVSTSRYKPNIREYWFPGHFLFRSAWKSKIFLLNCSLKWS
jgi:hypothetical protein